MATFSQLTQRVGFTKALEIWRNFKPDFIGQFNFEQLLEICKGCCSDLRLAVIDVLCTRATSFEQWNDICGSLPKTFTAYSMVLQKMVDTASTFEHWGHVYAACPRAGNYEQVVMGKMVATAVTFAQWRIVYDTVPEWDKKNKQTAKSRMETTGRADDWIELCKTITSGNSLYNIAVACLERMELSEELWLRICDEFSLDSGIGQLAIKKMRKFIEE